MNPAETLKWVHLVAAAVWTGGLITLAFLMVGLRKAGTDREQLRAAARTFAWVSWSALAVAVVTGVWQMELVGYRYSLISVKLTLVILAGVLALVHQLTSRRISPALRGIGQAIILVVSIGIFGAAVAAFG
jgi:putative copper export protein